MKKTLSQSIQQIQDAWKKFINAVMLSQGYIPISDYEDCAKKLVDFENKISHHRKQPEPKKLNFELLRYVYELDYIDGMRIQSAEYAEDIKRKCIETLMKEAEKYIDFHKLPPGNRYAANIYVAKRNFKL